MRFAVLALLLVLPVSISASEVEPQRFQVVPFELKTERTGRLTGTMLIDTKTGLAWELKDFDEQSLKGQRMNFRYFAPVESFDTHEDMEVFMRDVWKQLKAF